MQLSSFAVSLNCLWYPQMNYFCFSSVRRFSFVLISTPFIFYYLHHLLRNSKRKANWALQARSLPPIPKTALYSFVAQLRTFSPPPSILQLQETLPSFAQNVLPFPKQSFSMYFFPFICLSYRLQPALYMAKNCLTLFAIPILILDYFLTRSFAYRTAMRLHVALFAQSVITIISQKYL